MNTNTKHGGLTGGIEGAVLLAAVCTDWLDDAIPMLTELKERYSVGG